MFDQGSQIVQLVKQVGPDQSFGAGNGPQDIGNSAAPDATESAQFGRIVKTGQVDAASPLQFNDNMMLGKENLSGRTVLFPAGGAEQAVGASGSMSNAVKQAWKSLQGNISEFDDSIGRIGGEDMTYADTVQMSKKLVHLEAGFHLTFTALQKATQSFDTILRAQ